MVSIKKKYFISFLINLLWGNINEQYLMTGRPFYPLKKYISDFHWILVAKLSSRFIIFLSSEENMKPLWALLQPVPTVHLNVAVYKSR